MINQVTERKKKKVDSLPIADQERKISVSQMKVTGPKHMQNIITSKPRNC